MENEWWICKVCGFNAKEFEPREEKQPGAIKWHKALHETGRVNASNSEPNVSQSEGNSI